MNCPSYCVKFSTCHNDEEAKRTEKFLNACWDNIKDIKLNKKYGCYYKFGNRIVNYYNFGICPSCGDVYLNRIDDFPPVYKELDNLCRECDKGD